MRYTPKNSKLTIQVVECRNLKKMDILGSSGNSPNLGENERKLLQIRT